MVGGPQDADALHPQVSSSVTLSEVVFQLGRMVEEGAAVEAGGGRYRLP
jgi:hypothetical protein